MSWLCLRRLGQRASTSPLRSSLLGSSKPSNSFRGRSSTFNSSTGSTTASLTSRSLGEEGEGGVGGSGCRAAGGGCRWGDEGRSGEAGGVAGEVAGAAEMAADNLGERSNSSSSSRVRAKSPRKGGREVHGRGLGQSPGGPHRLLRRHQLDALLQEGTPMKFSCEANMWFVGGGLTATCCMVVCKSASSMLASERVATEGNTQAVSFHSNAWRMSCTDGNTHGEKANQLLACWL